MAETINKMKHHVNKIKEYPVLDPQQLLSLIRANQIMIADLEERLATLER